jgi:hypothetical protein
MVGPFFTKDTMSNAVNFVNTWTSEYPLGHNGTIVAVRLAALLNLQPVNTIITYEPSILMTNYIFVDKDKESRTLERQLFYNQYTDSKIPNDSGNYVQYKTHVSNIFLQGEGCTKTVSYNTNRDPTTVQINNACMIWCNDIYSYVRIVGSSRMFYPKIQVPVFYRFVTTIPKVNVINSSVVIDLSNPELNDAPLGDGLTTRINFSCPDVNDLHSPTPSWYVTCYTTDVDLGTLTPGGSFVNPCFPGNTCCVPGNTLLIVEATSLDNRRVLSWDPLNLSVSMTLNENKPELRFYEKFEAIVAQVYMAYTNTAFFAPTTGQVCSTDGICINNYPVDHTFNRESPQTTVLRLITNLYHGSNYPNLNLIPGTPACCNKYRI